MLARPLKLKELLGIWANKKKIKLTLLGQCLYKYVLMYLYCKYSPELVFIQLYISIVIILYYLHFQPHHSRFFHQSIEKKIINSMWCQFHEQFYQEFPVGIPRRFFLCEELLYTCIVLLLNFFFEKRICTTPRQGKARKSPLFLKCPQKKKRNSLKNEKNLFSSFFLHSKRNVLVIICHQDHVQLQSLKKRSCTSNTTVSFLMQEVLRIYTTAFLHI